VVDLQGEGCAIGADEAGAFPGGLDVTDAGEVGGADRGGDVGVGEQFAGLFGEPVGGVGVRPGASGR
jgi:hypothetical protein